MLLLLPLFVAAVLASTMWVASTRNMVCSAMAHRKKWDGPVEPYVRFTLTEAELEVSVALLGFEFAKDKATVEVTKGDEEITVLWFCDNYALQQGLCAEQSAGQYVLAKDADRALEIARVEATSGANVSYPVVGSGSYCVVTQLNGSYTGLVEFRNAWGHLSEREHELETCFWFYFVLYAVLVAVYGALAYVRRAHVRPLQQQFLAWLVYLMFTYSVEWGYLAAKNRLGVTDGVHRFWAFQELVRDVKFAGSWVLFGMLMCGHGVVFARLDRTTALGCWLLGAVTLVCALVKFLPEYLAYPRPVESFLWVPLHVVVPAWCYWIWKRMPTPLNVPRGVSLEAWKARHNVMETTMIVPLIMLFGVLVTWVLGVFFFPWRNNMYDSSQLKASVVGIINAGEYLVAVAVMTYFLRPSKTSNFYKACSQLQPEAEEIDLETLAPRAQAKENDNAAGERLLGKQPDT